MRIFSSITLLTLVTLTSLVDSAAAQTFPPAPPAASATMVQAAPPPPPPPFREGTAEFAFVGTTGNSSTQTIGLSGTLIVRPENWVITNGASYVRNETEGETTASILQYGFRAARTFSPRLSAFGEYSYFRNRFAGVEHRHTLLGGVSYKLVDDSRHLFAVDGALGYMNEQREVPPDVSSAVYAFGGTYRLKISETATFTDDLRFTGTFDEGDDWRLSHVAALSARLTTLLSLKLSHTIRYNNSPVAGFEKTDTITSVALVAKF